MKNYTIAEVAEIFKRSKKTIYRWREEGIFHEVIQVKDGYLISEKEVLRVIEERTKRANF
ncbi:MAG: helix-turn-helix domain-containing protein [Deltaproteobacteria bacterium]